MSGRHALLGAAYEYAHPANYDDPRPEWDALEAAVRQMQAEAWERGHFYCAAEQRDERCINPYLDHDLIARDAAAVLTDADVAELNAIKPFDPADDAYWRCPTCGEARGQCVELPQV